jgi:hypothetical protein
MEASAPLALFPSKHEVAYASGSVSAVYSTEERFEISAFHLSKWHSGVPCPAVNLGRLFAAERNEEMLEIAALYF